MDRREYSEGDQVQPVEGVFEITRVEQQLKKPGLYDLYLNGQYAYTVHEDTLVAMRLLKGAMLDQADLQRLERLERMHKALDKAIRWIGRRPHSRREIERKLRQLEIEEDAIADVLDKLQEQRLVDDKRFAEQWAESRIISQKKGRRLVSHELRQKGVAREDVEAAMHAIDPQVEYEHAMQLGKKKWQQTKGEAAARRQKTAAYLLRRGFPAELVRKVIRELGTDEFDAESEDLYGSD